MTNAYARIVILEWKAAEASLCDFGDVGEFDFALIKADEFIREILQHEGAAAIQQ